MTDILFLTAAYPYYPGEQFIEDEIVFWAKKSGLNVVCLPATADGSVREVPGGVEVSLEMAMSRSKLRKALAMLSASFSTLFLREIFSLIRNRKFGFRHFFEAVRAVSAVYRLRRPLRHVAKKCKCPPVVYCYWSDVQLYAALLLKREGLVSAVVSRAHGFDVYQERRPSSYMPLKRQFVDEVDYIFPVSKQAKAYLERVYGFNPEKVIVRPLGVNIPTKMTSGTEIDSVHIVSISYLVPVKRVDKIIDAISLASRKIGNTRIKWTHIGDGPEMGSLKSRASIALSTCEVVWSFIGQLANKEVKFFLERERIDFLVNASESEGVPVSMMEAMSYGIPVIGPRVGGVEELVSSDFGVLMGSDPTVEEIADAIVSMAVRAKKTEVRYKARDWVEKNYSADDNYKSIVAFVSALGVKKK